MYGADTLRGPLYRVAASCPPVLADFMSYEALGREYDRRDYFKGIGVSMYDSKERALEVARRFTLGHGVTTVELRSSSAVWAATGRRRPHLTVWAPAELLLDAVVQCVEA